MGRTACREPQYLYRGALYLNWNRQQDFTFKETKEEEEEAEEEEGNTLCLLVTRAIKIITNEVAVLLV
jgi:hypothetical protein